MKLRLLAPLFVAALLPAAAFAQAERNAVELRQGMTPEEVQQLLGKPRRTALSVSNGGYAGASEQGTLQWTYVWTGPASSSSAERSLQIDFASRAADQWTVKGWGWSRY